MILAAGFGTRMRPITEVLPKPLLPFFGVPLLYLAAWRLRKYGITSLAVNTHHLAGQIAEAIKTLPVPVDATVFHETAILGTGGVFNPIKKWQNNQDVVVYNSDIMCDIDIAAVLKHHKKAAAVATMVLLPKALPGKTPVYSAKGQVVGLGLMQREIRGKPTTHTFSGCHVLSRAFLAALPPSGPSEIKVAYDHAFREKLPVAAYLHHGLWDDLGSPDGYWEAHNKIFEWLKFARNFHLFEELGIVEILKSMKEPFQIFNGSAAKAAENAKIRGPAFISGKISLGDGAICGPKCASYGQTQIGADAEVSESILLDGAKVPAGAKIKRMILGSSFSIPF